MHETRSRGPRLARICAISALLLSGCSAMPKAPSAACYHSNAQQEEEIGYCEAIRHGDVLTISGVAGRGEMASAVRSVYDRLGKVLADNGFAFSDVVKENVYATDLDAFIQNKGIRKEYYAATLPAATWVQVQRLYVPSLVVEIELTAEKRR